MLAMILLGIGMGGAVGGSYILYLAFFKPGTFPKPGLAKKQGAAATLIGLIILLVYFHPWK